MYQRFVFRWKMLLLGRMGGDDCDTKTKCENDCNHRGLCDKGECICAPSYTGSDCSLDVERVKEEERLKQCSEGCSGHGICGYNMLDFTTGEPLARCLCESGFAGEFCEVALECKDSCSGRGECVNGHCICSCGYTGEACERVHLLLMRVPRIVLEEEIALWRLYVVFERGSRVSAITLSRCHETITIKHSKLTRITRL